MFRRVLLPPFRAVLKVEAADCSVTLVKLKVIPVQATKALRVGRGIALPNLRPRH